MELTFLPYTEEWENRWDELVLHGSVNGTFLQTRHFLNYHPKGRFTDASLLILQGSTLIGVIPACEAQEEGRRCFYSHRGSTFGGIILTESKYNISTLEALFPRLESYLAQQGYACAFFKPTSAVFSHVSPELMDYFFYKEGYTVYEELSLYLDCASLAPDILASFSSGRRRDTRYAIKNGLVFRALSGDKELEDFYVLLTESLKRHQASPIHTLSELKFFRDTWLKDTVAFYGVFHGDTLIAGTMLFYFGKDVLHTQYLAQDASYASLFPMNFLNYQLIKLARDEGFRRFSFGISTEERGTYLNTGLAVFKEGFGTQAANNRSYFKILQAHE
ncbi:MAG: GNAT family N-acetyltransferase [Clostridia bacterium]|nr:GNAT family N-acetyltransferase [Clostridia bacterium]